MTPDSIGIFAVARVALGIGGLGLNYFGNVYQSWLYLVNVFFMAPDSTGIFALAYVALRIGGFWIYSFCHFLSKVVVVA